jgi:pyruvate kinase
MLSGETAVGAYPVRAVQTLDAVIRDAEAMLPVDSSRRRLSDLERVPMLAEHGPAICQAAVTLAELSRAAAIVAVTRGGKTARMLSAMRPRTPIYAATNQPDIARRLTLCWGVVPWLTDLSGDVDSAAARIGCMLVERGAVSPSSVIVLVSISLELRDENANFLKLLRV